VSVPWGVRRAHPEPDVELERVANVEARGRGWSSTEWRMFEVVAGLTADRPFNIVGVLLAPFVMGASAIPVVGSLAGLGVGASHDVQKPLMWLGWLVRQSADLVEVVRGAERRDPGAPPARG
jgi:hypothetical protein